MATGALDANGIWQYGEDDSNTTFSALLNRLGSSTSTQVASLKVSGRVVQTVSTTKTDTFSSPATTPAAITGLSAAITPRSSTNKVLVTVTLMVAASAGSPFSAQLYRGATLIGAGDAAGTRTRVSNSTFIEAGGQRSFSFSFLDSPATTSATTYSVSGFGVSGTWYINRSSADLDGAAYVRSSSTITLMEVAA